MVERDVDGAEERDPGESLEKEASESVCQETSCTIEPVRTNETWRLCQCLKKEVTIIVFVLHLGMPQLRIVTHPLNEE